MPPDVPPDLPSDLPPEAPPALQPERTGMAWIRTLVGLAGAWGLVGLHALVDRGWSLIGLGSLAVGAGVLVLAGTIGARRTRAAQAGMAGGSTMTTPVANLAVAVATALAAVVALAATW